MKTLFCTILLAVSVAASAATGANGYQTDSLGAVEHAVDRWSFKTNAFEWLLTIPNFGVEMDLTKSEFNKLTVGLTAKYNWNTYHNVVPSTVFNIMDIRPEFRYYYRTKKPAPGVAHHWYDFGKYLKERKHPRPWIAHYVGVYGNYGHYSLKIGKPGYQGKVAGFGASAGCVLPVYEYKHGFIDMEFGAAVGVQWASKDKYVHNREANCYTIVESRDGFEFTPFPVLSELRVAIVWRTKSIKDKVRDDVEKRKIQTYYEKIKEDFSKPLLEMTKAFYDEVLVNTKSERERSNIMKDFALYNEGFMEMLASEEEQQLRYISTSFPDEMKNHERKDLRELVVELEKTLCERVNEARKTSMDAFKKEAKVYFKDVKKQLKQEKAQNKEQEKADKKAGKDTSKSEKTEKAEKSDKVEKKAKEEKTDKKVKEEKPEKKEKAAKGEDKVKEEKSEKKEKPEKAVKEEKVDKKEKNKK